MIDEKKLIEAITKGEYTTGNIFADMELQQFIKDFPKVGEWILCSERLPENYETVNITWVNRNPVSYYEHIKDKPFTGTAIFYYGKWYWYSCVCEDYLRDCGDSEFDRMDKDIEVIAWQPLPEPYKE